jgi:hypothetical protein
MKARFIGSTGSFDDLPKPGDIAIGHPNYHGGLMVNCPVCHGLHVVNFTDANRLRWDWGQATLTLSPSVKITHHDRTICHWNLINGEFIIHGDSTAKPGPHE